MKEEVFEHTLRSGRTNEFQIETERKVSSKRKIQPEDKSKVKVGQFDRSKSEWKFVKVVYYSLRRRNRRGREERERDKGNRIARSNGRG